ncbi:MAG: hypothetical protein QF918_12650 [Pirellulaceae bacterium]|nr:hypothetical protein [Pirellulaceae bacterium]
MTGHLPESQTSKSLHPANPFSTCAVRPGAIQYQFPSDDSPAKLLVRLRDNCWWGEIVGPHGSGKSTLIQMLLPAFQNAGRKVHLVTPTSGERRLPAVAHDMSDWDDQTQVVIDGFEQLGWWQRRSLKRACRGCGCGLLITAHASLGFPPLLTTTTSLGLTEQLVFALLSEHATNHISTAEIEDAFSRHEGNVREIFFDLYDRYEQHARS